MYILDAGNQRIQQFTPGSNVGVTVFEGSYNSGFGSTAYSMIMDSLGNLYVADYNGMRVQKITLVTRSSCSGIMTTTAPTITTTTRPSVATCSTAVYKTNATSVITNLTGYPYATALDTSNNIYVSDSTVRVYKFSTNTTTFSNSNVIAPMIYQTLNTGGSSLSQIGLILGLFIEEKTNSIYMSDIGGYISSNYYYGSSYNYRIQRWSLTPGTVAGTTVAGYGSGSASGSYNSISASYGLYVDSYGTLFVSDNAYRRVTTWPQNTVSGILVAGTEVAGSNLTYLNGPQGIWIDRNANIFVVVSGNHRVVKWTVNATSGILVAGGFWQRPFSTQFNWPTAIIIDAYGNMYILDAGNQRIQQFTPGNKVGVTIFDASYNSAFGSTAYSMAMDSFGNLYVADYIGMRVQKINVVARSSCSGITTTTARTITNYELFRSDNLVPVV
ncbi:unnamed protein product [Rotaria socialis]|uniref:NHL repeat containing protein n=1 Tax=Rotaria socialis TaxID=392032 RepID=A0A820NJK0_9BILA|nr:unnamed protein product [Rotaria socialis]